MVLLAVELQQLEAVLLGNPDANGTHPCQVLALQDLFAVPGHEDQVGDCPADRSGPGMKRGRTPESLHHSGEADRGALLDGRCVGFDASTVRRRAGQGVQKLVEEQMQGPLSPSCSACGHKDGKKKVVGRRWNRSACGVEHDRDTNAAKNVLAAGLAERLNAGGAGSRSSLTLPGLAAGIRLDR